MRIMSWKNRRKDSETRNDYISEKELAWKCVPYLNTHHGCWFYDFTLILMHSAKSSQKDKINYYRKLLITQFVRECC